MKLISKKPEILVSQMQQMIKGLAKYAENFQPTGPTKEDLETAIVNLNTSMQNQKEAAGIAETATQDLYEIRDNAVNLARRMRDSIYAFFGKNDKRIVQFGLDTPKRPRSNNKTNGHDEESTNP